MQPAIVLRVFIASPGDVAAKRERAVNIISDWNAVHSLTREAIVEAIRVETHAQAEQGDHPQEIINRQLLDRCDALIAIFWAKLGMKTNTEQSGTIHEIKAFAERKGHGRVMLFFSEAHLPHNVNTNDIEAVRAFKKEMQPKGLYIAYRDLSDFESKLRRQLDLCVNGLLASDEAKSAWSERAIVDEQQRLLFEMVRAQTEKAIGRTLSPSEVATGGPGGMSVISEDTTGAKLQRIAQTTARRWGRLGLNDMPSAIALMETTIGLLQDVHNNNITSEAILRVLDIQDKCRQVRRKLDLEGNLHLDLLLEGEACINSLCDLADMLGPREGGAKEVTL